MDRRPALKAMFRAGVILAVFLLVAMAIYQQHTKPPQAVRRSSTRHVSREAFTRADEYDRILASKDRTVSSADAELHEIAAPVPKPKRSTLMIYMIGSNLESRNAAASADLREMVESGVDLTQTNVIVYAGGSNRWNSKVPTGCNNVLDLSLPEGDWVVAQTNSNVSMGASQTLAAFINYCTTHYPAEHNAIVFWDHGNGPLWGYGNDELHDGDGLILSEMRDAMEETDFATSKPGKLDWVGFDACLMGSIENASLWKDYTNNLVVSEETEPGDGWNYAFLNALNNAEDPAQICSAIVASYEDHYKRTSSAFSNPEVTLAYYDLAKLDSVVEAFNSLLESLRDMLAEGGYADLC